jgi:hypothetical protein
MKKQILDAILSADENELIYINNAYCQAINNSDSEVFDNDEEFFSMFFPNAGDGIKVARAIFYGDYNYSHNWVKFNGYGNLESISFFGVDDLCELPEVMAEYIAENFEEFNHLDTFADIEETEEIEAY